MNKVTLQSVVKEFIDCRGVSPQKVENGIPLVTAKIIKNGRILPPNEFVTEENYIQRLKRGVVTKGDILITTEAPLGEVAQVKTNKKMAFGQRIIALKVDDSKISNTFLYYNLLSPLTQQRLLNKQSGSTVKGIKSSELKQLELDIPPLHEQQKIASVLSALDDQIELNKQINQELEDLAQTLYNYWFVQFEFPNEEGKPYKSSGGKMVWNEELKREIPVGWEVKKLKDSTMLNYGKNLPLKSIKGGCFSVYGANGIIGKHSQYTHENPCIIVGCRGSVGNVSRINEKCFITNNSISIESEDISYSFLFNYWKTQTFNKSITGSVQKQLTIENISKELMLLPSKSVEKKFSRKCDFLYNYIHQNEKQNQELAQLRDYILPLLMNGQVTVSDSIPE